MKFGKPMDYIPDSGDIVWIMFNPQAGHEKAGHRPALILSPQAYNGKVGLALLCLITSHVKDYPFEVKIPDGLEVGGAILSDQVKSLDWKARHAKFSCKIPPSIFSEVVQKLNTLINPLL